MAQGEQQVTDAAAAPGRARAGSLLRHSAVMAAGSLVSRLTGFLRTAVVAAALGSTLVGDAYTTAQFIPGMIYELLLGGILASVVVPLLVRARDRDGDGGDAYAQRLLTLAVLALGATTLLAVVAAPLLTGLLAGSDSTPASRDLITALGYLILPTIFFYGLAALLAAVLNTRDHFAAPMWAPILNNAVVIGTFVTYIAVYGARPLVPEQLTGGQVLLVGVGTFLGIVVQSLALWPALRRVGFRWRWRFDVRALRLRELAQLGAWAFCYVAVSQLGLVVLIRLANEASTADDEAAGPLIYNNTYLLLMMAHGIIAVSIITALLPRMSSAAAAGRYADFTDDLSRGTRMSAVVLAPIAVGYAVLAQPIARTLFEYGAFTREDSLATSLVLLVAAFALVPFSVSQLYTFAFYALPDTRTPALVNLPVVAVRVGVQLILAAVLAPVLVAAGLMLGNAVSFVLAAFASGVLLRRRVGPIGLRRILSTFGKAALAALGAAVAGLVAVRLVGAGFDDGARLASFIQLAAGGAAIVAAYVGLALALRMGEVADVVGMVRRRLPR
ncbi:MAG TPA: murein biosynthesis integral membrane protein MurJ [Micromonosporaceae bacterium]|nr:murein biosynthesis integral membrane protein MurJ [Micromonosporaceae bacterium]